MDPIVHRESNTNKWKKYELLNFLGLTNIDYLRRTINIFKRVEINKLIEYIDKQYTINNSEEKKMIVIKFVTINDYGQLTNLRIYQKENIRNLYKRIQENSADNVVEYWACPSIVIKACGNFSGRYLQDTRGLTEEIIELIWWTSPRLLESNIEAGEYPYARFRKKYASISYRNEKMIIPEDSNVLNELSILEAFKKVIHLITEHKQSVNWFKEIIKSININSFSLEFKFENGIGKFIDWDTANDKKVLEKFQL